ncbi:MAG: YciI family protein [Steroidobacteraceae bacterium]
MTYMLLVVEPQGDRARRTPEEGRVLFERMVEWSEHLKSRKLLLGVNSLKTEATRLAVRAGSSRRTDGPFTESKELIGGYFLVDCRTRAEAVELAQNCPAAQWATMEVREIGPCFE